MSGYGSRFWASMTAPSSRTSSSTMTTRRSSLTCGHVGPSSGPVDDRLIHPFGGKRLLAHRRLVDLRLLVNRTDSKIR